MPSIFCPVAYSKIERRERETEGRSSKGKREPGHAVFEDFQPLQTAHDDKIKKWLLSKDQIEGTFRKTSSNLEAKGMAVKP